MSRADSHSATLDTVGPHDEEAAPGQGAFNRVRDRLAGRFGWLDSHNPYVLEVLADVHMTLHNRLRGMASAVRGNYKPRHWRKVLLGEAPLYLADLIRLALSRRREVQEAVDEALEILAEARGYRLVPAGRHETADMVPVTAMVGDCAGRLSAACSAAMVDGQIDAREIEAIEALQREVAIKVSNWRASKAVPEPRS